MKQRYTVTVAGYEMKIISDESPESVEESVAALERTIRAITSRSRTVPMTEAVFLAALSAHSDKRRGLCRIHELETELEKTRAELEEARRLIASLTGAPAAAPAEEKDDALCPAPAAQADVKTETGTAPAPENERAADGSEAAGEAPDEAAEAPALDDLEEMLRERLRDAQQ